jgi:type II secretory pathway pseudopilin PulG
MRNMNSAGDTIVEVLIAMAVISSVLAITYSTMNRNILISRDNQERTEASKLAQGQIEAVKNLASTDELALNAARANPFCLNGLTPTTNSVFQDDYLEDITTYPGQCIKGLYHIAIRYNSVSGVYYAHVRWESLSGTRSESVIAYRY